MKKIGILGGVGWASTVDYYRAIAEGASRHFANRGHSSPLPIPPMTIESVTQAKTRGLRLWHHRLEHSARAAACDPARYHHAHSQHFRCNG